MELSPLFFSFLLWLMHYSESTRFMMESRSRRHDTNHSDTCFNFEGTSTRPFRGFNVCNYCREFCGILLKQPLIELSQGLICIKDHTEVKDEVREWKWWDYFFFKLFWCSQSLLSEQLPSSPFSAPKKHFTVFNVACVFFSMNSSCSCISLSLNNLTTIYYLLSPY